MHVLSHISDLLEFSNLPAYHPQSMGQLPDKYVWKSHSFLMSMLHAVLRGGVVAGGGLLR